MKKVVLLLFLFFHSQKIRASTEDMIPALDWPLIGMEVGLGGLLGFAIGFFFKKSLKIVFFSLGLLSLILVLLNQIDFINIRWEMIEGAYLSAMEGTGGSKEMLTNLSLWLKERIPLGGGLLVGFFTGIKFG